MQTSHPHFMLKEICEQPEVLAACLSQYFPSQPQPLEQSLPVPEQIHILACGTSRHAGLVAQYWFEQIAGIPTRVRSASEYVAAPLPLTANTLTIAITQSGETTDTLSAVDQYQQQVKTMPTSANLTLLGITNQPASSLARKVDDLLPTLAGDEVGVAATKTFTTQLAVLASLVLDFARRSHKINATQLEEILVGLRSLPQQIQTILNQQNNLIQPLAQTFVAARGCIVLGQGVNRAIALEGGLKLKETTYLHAEGYAAGEFLHGPIALVDPAMPIIAIVPSDHTHEQVMTTVQKVRSHGAPVIGIAALENHPEIFEEFDHLIPIPPIHPLLSPFLNVIPLQLLAYHIAVQRGLNVDKPRHITKTVV